jgi:polysaccharide deacetylase 2 family uncharacterized protein YibQ
MTNPRANRYKQKPGGGRFAALALLALILLIVAGYFVFDRSHHPANPANPIAPVPPAAPSAQSPPVAAPLPPVVMNNVTSLPVSPQTVPPQPAPPPPIPTPPVAPQSTPPRSVPTHGKALLAIIIDDMGTNMQEARELADIGVPVTFSIIPGLRGYREVAAFAASGGIETMIHIPMQPKGWPQRRLESNGLLIAMEDADITAHVEQYIRDIPGAKGANNHMGSEFTEHGDKMKPVLKTLGKNGLFFIDSVTTPRTTGIRLARAQGVKSGSRNVFLDNEQNDAYIRGQLNQAVALAKKNGAAIAICHPHPVTIKTLAAALPGLERQGVTLVAVSRLAR